MTKEAGLADTKMVPLQSNENCLPGAPMVSRLLVYFLVTVCGPLSVCSCAKLFLSLGKVLKA